MPSDNPVVSNVKDKIDYQQGVDDQLDEMMVCRSAVLQIINDVIHAFVFDVARLLTTVRCIMT
ncbi:MAG: hypothetical protein P8J18_07280 [Halieaceae bacterium]|nr:hypothetical protein [Halieaceae bacterium]